MMHENVTKTYKKCNTNKSNSINFKAKQIACKSMIVKIAKRAKRSVQLLSVSKVTPLLITATYV